MLLRNKWTLVMSVLNLVFFLSGVAHTIYILTQISVYVFFMSKVTYKINWQLTYVKITVFTFLFRCVIFCEKKASPKMQPAFERMNAHQFLAQIQKHPVRAVFASHGTSKTTVTKKETAKIFLYFERTDSQSVAVQSQWNR